MSGGGKCYTEKQNRKGDRVTVSDRLGFSEGIIYAKTQME